MGKYDFDTIIDRRDSEAIKVNLKEEFGREDLIPLWVADMDFATPEPILKALRKKLEHPILGYPSTKSWFWKSIMDWIRYRHGWEVKREWLDYVPGIVRGIGFAVDVFTSPGDKIIIQTPVYHPFRLVPEGIGREVVSNPLKETPDHRWEMDFDGLEALASDPAAKMMILCNPHNPTGTSWSPETLSRVAEICSRNGIIVISDEIHSDIVLFGHRHTPFAMASPEAASCSITFASPSKTFNMPGLCSSYAIVPDPAIRKRFFSYLEALEIDYPTVFATHGTRAAFEECRDWREEMLSYVEANVLYVEDFLKKNDLGIRFTRPEATYLVWLDCRRLGLDHEGLVDLFEDKAHLALNDGEMFGAGGEGHMRLNVATPRPVLERAMENLAKAVRSVS